MDALVAGGCRRGCRDRSGALSQLVQELLVRTNHGVSTPAHAQNPVSVQTQRQAQGLIRTQYLQPRCLCVKCKCI